LVDSRGKVRTVSNFGRRMTVMIWLIVLSLLLCGVMAFFYLRIHGENDRLRAEVADLQNSLEKATMDKELLMARVVIAESTTVKPAEESLSAAAPLEENPAPVAEAERPESKPLPEPEPAPKEAAEPDPPPKPAVEVGNFEARYRKDRSRIEVAYSLKNTGSTKAEGRSVAVLSTDGAGGDRLIAIPRVWLENGRPQGNRGRRFSIRRFMRVNLDREVEVAGVRVTQAEVFVFAENGELLTRKRFPVALTLPEKEIAATPKTPPKPDPEPAPAAITTPPAPPVSDPQPSGSLQTLGIDTEAPVSLPVTGSSRLNPPDPPPGDPTGNDEKSPLQP
jgi:outer membrane biosynthesis protein TonB